LELFLQPKLRVLRVQGLEVPVELLYLSPDPSGLLDLLQVEG